MMTRKPLPEEKGDRFNAILDRYDKFLRSTIARICPKDLGLQFADIQQEARIQLWRVIESEREISHPGSYIYRIALHAAILSPKLKERGGLR